MSSTDNGGASNLEENIQDTPHPSNHHKRPRALELFRKKVKAKAPPISASTKAAQKLIEESESRVQNEKRKAELEEIEHNARIQLINKKIELKEKKIKIQEKILDILDTNPEKITINFK